MFWRSPCKLRFLTLSLSFLQWCFIAIFANLCAFAGLPHPARRPLSQGALRRLRWYPQPPRPVFRMRLGRPWHPAGGRCC